MSLLREIQASLISDEPNLGGVLLKLRLLAARLGSDILSDWVKHEMSGYPTDVDLPDYRVIGVSFKGTFSGPFGSGINNAPIPTALVEQHAGEHWSNHRVRQGIAAIDDLVKSAQESGSLGLDCSNLILLLQGKIYEDYACNDIRGSISRSALVQIQNEVKSRALELTIELEKSVPAAVEIVLVPEGTDNIDKSEVSKIINQTIYGNYTEISNSGDSAHIEVKAIQGNADAFQKILEDSGISQESAKELSEIIQAESPDSKDEPLGSKAKKWLLSNLKKAEDGTWNVGISVATDVIKNAVKGYYGL
ncbi:AbiTii domain-containing protein [Vibrio alginolyticus]|uniref:AbiTii domain-containing protein n=1 Tax=Vibrio alginolyticus TaxID=663 RepID=UPI00215CEBA3|nr:hypothetical protein [Vibrio alginolyticus]MCR9382535.1 hypothetical protein [Vibrio alginolyticus]MCR9428717.1 hypothetical protein [Vibrio alginolyticus]MCR9436741.1 hypothetical protein [Vibrio alginolyticus]